MMTHRSAWMALGLCASALACPCAAFSPQTPRSVDLTWQLAF